MDTDKKNTAPTDARNSSLDSALARVMSVSVVASAIIAIIGAALLLTRGGTTGNLHDYQPQPAEMRSLGSIMSAARNMKPLAIIQLGVLLLIATPVLRVFFSLVLFAARKDWLYTVITTIVLAVLLVGLLGAAA